MNKRAVLVLGCAILLSAVFVQPSFAQVLGACGTPSEDEPAMEAAAGAPAAPQPAGMAVHSVPLPGERAINFELPAVVGDEIKNVKLSDYNGMWRVVCFYPADFTFV